MSWMPHIHDLWKKIVVSVAGIIIMAVLGWVGLLISGWFTSIVHADELQAILQSQIGTDLDKLRAQSAANSHAICRSQKVSLRASIRDLRVEIAEMKKREGGPDWDATDAALLVEWEEDLLDAEEQYERLDC